jgi:hypothetical protein
LAHVDPLFKTNRVIAVLTWRRHVVLSHPGDASWSLRNSRVSNTVAAQLVVLVGGPCAVVLSARQLNIHGVWLATTLEPR